MWILVRILILFVILGYRWLARLEKKLADETRQWRGREYGLALKHDNHNKLVTATVELSFFGSCWFQLDAESRSDRLLKALGLAREFQTGNKAFDEAIYISCDQTAVQSWFANNSRALELVQQLIQELNATSIRCQGYEVLITFAINEEPDETRLQTAFALLDQLKPLKDLQPQPSDPFFWRIIAVESLLWSIAAYAIGGYIEYRFELLAMYASPADVLYFACTAGVLALIATYTSCRLLVGRSSRGRLVILEAFTLLIFTLPYASVLATKEINELQPSATPAVAVATVNSLYVDERPRRTTYHAVIATSDNPASVEFPSTLKLSSTDYSRIKPGWQVCLKVQRGLLQLGYVSESTFFPAPTDKTDTSTKIRQKSCTDWGY